LEQWNKVKTETLERMKEAGIPPMPDSMWLMLQVCYYSGWADSLGTMSEGASKGPEVTQEDMDMLYNVNKELQEFGKRHNMSMR
jgi:hypothetical protein